MFDPNNPDQMMNNGQSIPINTQGAYDAVQGAAKAVYEAAGRPYDDDAQKQTERRVLGGMTSTQVIAETLKDRKARFNES